MKFTKITSAVVTVVFAAVSFALPAAAAKLAAPKNLRVTGKAATSISLSWDKSESAAKYAVYYSTDKKKEYTLYGNTNLTRATVKKLQTDTKYWFYVRAIDKDGNKSGYAKVVSAIPKAAEKTETAAAASSSASTSSKLTITQAPGKVQNNNIAVLKATGKPNTTYKLLVYYSTTASTAKGTGKAVSDKNGVVSWSWKVGANTKSGTHKIVIEGNDEKIETTFETYK